MLCDVCSNPIEPPNFYTLTTSQVVCSQPYWKFCLEQLERTRPGYTEKHPSVFLTDVVLIQSAVGGYWAICPKCIGHFDVDRSNAKKLAKETTRAGRYGPIPGGGAANEKIAFLVASLAWKEMYGSNLLELLKADVPHVGHIELISDEPGTTRENIRRILRRRILRLFERGK